MPAPVTFANGYYAPNPEVRHKYRFRVYDNANQQIGSFTEINGLQKETEVVEWRTGDDNFTKTLPGVSKQSPITLIRGIDDNSYFELWYERVWSRNSEPSRQYKRDLYIIVSNRDGTDYKQINVYGAWPSKYILGDLNAKDSAPWVETLEMQHDGWDSVNL
jgi:phage tail-like protein